MMATNGVVFQMSAIIRPITAEVGVPRMTGLPKPNALRM
jgi:hypothetical protein